MAVMSIRVDNEKRKKLKAIASVQGKTMSGIIEEMIDEYIRDFHLEYSDEKETFDEIMKVSESSFNEWDNPEDEVYNDM